MKNANIVDILIQNIKIDQELLKQTEINMELVKQEKQIIVSRLKDYRRDVSVLLKYADDTKKKELETLGFDFSETQRGLNPVATTVLDIIMKAKGHQITNGDLYTEYVKSFKNSSDSVNYTEFNIKCRSLFNAQRLLRKKGTDEKNSREDVISLSGSIVESVRKNSK